MMSPKWFVNGVEKDYYDIYNLISTIKTLEMRIGKNVIIVNYINGYFTINGEVTKPKSSTDTYEPLYTRRTRGERYSRELKKTIPNFLGWQIGWTATRVDKKQHIKLLWINPDGTYEWRNHK